MTFPLPGANWGNTHTLRLVAATGAAGYALADSTGPVISWTAPADGNLHRFIVFASAYCTSAETGGEIEITYTMPNGDAVTVEVFSPNQAAGQILPDNATLFVLESGGTVSLNQTSALTAGAATMWAEIWAL
jgi:hypothetical protein